jgi:uncharacterized membrane protein HdeD (DUF308 family)
VSTVSSVLTVSIIMVIAGVAEVVNACQLKSWSKFRPFLMAGRMRL